MFEIKGSVFTRPDGSFVVDSPHGIKMYHVTREDNPALFEQVTQYCSKHPELVEPEPVPEVKAPTEEEVRALRAFYLSCSDKYMLRDFPITKEQLTEITAYRQALRDLPTSEEWPNEVIWPQKPSWAQ